MTPPDLDGLRALDARDPLASKRAEFLIPGGVIYLDGNSLGVLPARVPERMERVVREEWGQDLIRSWNTHGWIDLPARVGARIARLIGADADEVIAADSTSVNLFKVLSAALHVAAKGDPRRRVIVAEEDNFPTDLYIAQGLAALLGEARAELRLVAPHRVADAVGDDTAVLMLTQVDYRTGERHDLPAVTRRAHERGALAVWDLAHSAGAFPVDLNGAGADFAVGCGYKYLNGGPGAPAFLYVARRHHADAPNVLSGWMGHASPFEFTSRYTGASGIGQYATGTPSILSLSALDAALEVFEDVEMRLVREKSLSLTRTFIELTRPLCARHGFRLATPEDDARRGSQVSLAHPHGYEIMQALIAAGVVGDFRAPNLLRFGFTPLYTSHEDVWHAVQTLDTVMREGRWQDARYAERNAVT
ncbi:kynureninase [Deinococcus aetherius]|uniref:Kynureninase n=1 Tax=Deinococcus aetherius TaxID=200252 RepID=A0ABN6RH31_9DEIO|nr:kynureninase [Deinococcus aetherius]BDP40927.1 kynureninase [Deinococcus aetherius]